MLLSKGANGLGWVMKQKEAWCFLCVSSAVRWLNGDIWGLGCRTGQGRACWFFLWLLSSTMSTWKREEEGRGHRSRQKKSNVFVLAVLSRKRTRWKRSKRTATHQSSCRCTGGSPTRHPPPHPRDDAFCHLCPSPCHPAHFLLRHWPCSSQLRPQISSLPLTDMVVPATCLWT